MIKKGITIEHLMLLTAYPEPTTREKINRRVNQYTEYEIAQLRNQIAEVQRQTNVLTAQAQAEAAKLTGSTVVQKSLDQLQLQADEEAIERWDGHLPPIRTGNGQTVIVDSNLVRMMQGQQAGRQQSAPRQQEEAGQ
jgi:hypothetical protein